MSRAQSEARRAGAVCNSAAGIVQQQDAGAVLGIIVQTLQLTGSGVEEF